MAAVLEDAELDEAQEARLEREFAREYHLITRADRLDAVAADIVAHFAGRGFVGKAMVVCVDKADRGAHVRQSARCLAKTFRRMREDLRQNVSTIGPMARLDLEKQIAILQTTDMAVVVSQGQNEIEDMAALGLDMRPHRLRMVKEDLATKFKDPDDPFRLVFVCAMWMTGFDAPACSTIYLDKPMRNHTLMQTIARANRVFGEKVNGLIVDYIGVFETCSGRWRSTARPRMAPLRRVSCLSRPDSPGGATRPGHRHGDFPLHRRGRRLGGDPDAPDEFHRIARLDDAVKALITNDAAKLRYLSLASDVARLYSAILPDPLANGFDAQTQHSSRSWPTRSAR